MLEKVNHYLINSIISEDRPSAASDVRNGLIGKTVIMEVGPVRIDLPPPTGTPVSSQSRFLFMRAASTDTITRLSRCTLAASPVLRSMCGMAASREPFSVVTDEMIA